MWRIIDTPESSNIRKIAYNTIAMFPGVFQSRGMAIFTAEELTEGFMGGFEYE